MKSSWHPYAHDGQKSVMVVLAVVAVLFAYAFDRGLNALAWKVHWLIDAPAPIAFFGWLSWFFNRVAWKWAPIRWLHGVPDLNGEYRVTIRSSSPMSKGPMTATLRVAQRFDQLSVVLETEESTSASTGAWLDEAPAMGTALTYAFRNQPKPGARAKLEAHEGTASLVFAPAKTATGTYYTGRGRETHGALDIEPESFGV